VTLTTPTSTRTSNGEAAATLPRHPFPIRADDDAFVPLAAEVGAVAAEHAAEHDRDASFVGPAYDVMRGNGYLALAVPTELGGLGANLRQVCYAQAELARHDGATSLASTMHLYNTLVQVFRRRMGAPDAEGVLRRVAEENLIIATSGGSDWIWPTTVAVPDGTTYRVSGRKAFCSQAPEATVISTSAVVGEPGDGAEVLHFSVPLAAEGVTLVETWDTMGMRGTASHDLVLEDVVVPAERIVARRPWGQLGPALTAAGLHFAPLGAATYFGIAAGARDVAVTEATAKARGAAPLAELARVQRQVGLIDNKLSVAWWALMSAIDQLGDDYKADPATLSTMMLAKRHVVLEAVEVVDLAMHVLGGRAYFRTSPLERAYRDVRAGTFHPFTPEVTLAYAGKLALGDPGLTE
jgi:alkylation response protein AidB-like acyl-CoA dehydrogenase